MAQSGLDPTFPAVPEAAEGEVTLWWLGQAGFALRYRDSLVLIDPYMSDTLAEKYRGKMFPHTRMVPVPIAPEAIRGVDAVLCTHGHTDHMDPGTIRAVQVGSDPAFVVPRAERAKAIERGVPADRLVEINAGEALALAGISVHAIPAAHEELTLDADGQYLHLGYVMDFGGLRLYHSGDCVPYSEQADLLRALDVHLALLPVNGRDALRSGNGVPGNFHLHEALELCRAAGIPALLCHHWGMFDFNTASPEVLTRVLSAQAGDLRWTVPEVGVPYVVARSGAVRQAEPH